MEEKPITGPPIERIYNEDLRYGTIVDASKPLHEIAQLLDRDGTVAAYTVDTRGRYQGLITATDLLAWLKHTPDTMEATGQPAWERLGTHLQDTAAEHAINPKSDRAPVEPTEPITHALNRMLTTGLPVAPVVTPDGTIEGEITLTRALIHAHDAQPSPR